MLTLDFLQQQGLVWCVHLADRANLLSEMIRFKLNFF